MARTNHSFGVNVNPTVTAVAGNPNQALITADTEIVYGGGSNGGSGRPGWTVVGLLGLIGASIALLLIFVFVPLLWGWTNDNEEFILKVGEASLSRDTALGDELGGQLESLRQGTEQGLNALWDDQKRQDGECAILATDLTKVRKTVGWNSSQISKGEGLFAASLKRIRANEGKVDSIDRELDNFAQLELKIPNGGTVNARKNVHVSTANNGVLRVRIGRD